MINPPQVVEVRDKDSPGKNTVASKSPPVSPKALSPAHVSPDPPPQPPPPAFPSPSPVLTHSQHQNFENLQQIGLGIVEVVEQRNKVPIKADHQKTVTFSIDLQHPKASAFARIDKPGEEPESEWESTSDESLVEVLRNDFRGSCITSSSSSSSSSAPSSSSSSSSSSPSSSSSSSSSSSKESISQSSSTSSSSSSDSDSDLASDSQSRSTSWDSIPKNQGVGVWRPEKKEPVKVAKERGIFEKRPAKKVTFTEAAKAGKETLQKEIEGVRAKEKQAIPDNAEVFGLVRNDSIGSSHNVCEREEQEARIDSCEIAEDNKEVERSLLTHTLDSNEGRQSADTKSLSEGEPFRTETGIVESSGSRNEASSSSLDLEPVSEEEVVNELHYSSPQQQAPNGIIVDSSIIYLPSPTQYQRAYIAHPPVPIDIRAAGFELTFDPLPFGFRDVKFGYSPDYIACGVSECGDSRACVRYCPQHCQCERQQDSNHRHHSHHHNHHFISHPMHFAQPSSHPPPSPPPPYSPNIDSGTEADIDIDISRCEHRANIHRQQRKQGEMKMDENEVLTPILFETQQEEQRGMRKKGRRRKMMEKSKRRSKSKIGSECKCCEEKRQRRRRERMENKSASHEMCRKSKSKKYSELEKGVCTAAGTAYSEASGSVPVITQAPNSYIPNKAEKTITTTTSHSGGGGLLRDIALGACAGGLGALVGIMVDRRQRKKQDTTKSTLSAPAKGDMSRYISILETTEKLGIDSSFTPDEKQRTQVYSPPEIPKTPPPMSPRTVTVGAGDVRMETGMAKPVHKEWSGVYFDGGATMELQTDGREDESRKEGEDKRCRRSESHSKSHKRHDWEMVELRKQGVTIAMAPPPSPRLSEIPKATTPPLPAHAQLSHPTTAKANFGFWEGLSTPATDTKASSAAGINNNVKILACPDDNVWTLVEDGYKGKEETIVPVMRGALSPQDVGNTRRKSRKSGMSGMVQIPPLAPLGTSVWSKIMSAQARVPQGSVGNVSQVPVAGETDISKSVPIQSASTSARPLPPARKRAPKLSHEKLRQRPRNSKGYVPPPPFSIPRSGPTAPQTSTQQQQRNAAGKTETDGDQVKMRNTNAERGEGSVKVGGGQIEKEMGEIWPPLRRLGGLRY